MNQNLGDLICGGFILLALIFGIAWIKLATASRTNGTGLQAPPADVFSNPAQPIYYQIGIEQDTPAHGTTDTDPYARTDREIWHEKADRVPDPKRNR